MEKLNSSVIRQKGEFQNVVCVSGGKKCFIFVKFDMLFFLETPVLSFAILPYDQRIVKYIQKYYLDI